MLRSRKLSGGGLIGGAIALVPLLSLASSNAEGSIAGLAALLGWLIAIGIVLSIACALTTLTISSVLREGVAAERSPRR